jgi:hypothetical protein
LKFTAKIHAHTAEDNPIIPVSHTDFIRTEKKYSANEIIGFVDMKTGNENGCEAH